MSVLATAAWAPEDVAPAAAAAIDDLKVDRPGLKEQCSILSDSSTTCDDAPSPSNSSLLPEGDDCEEEEEEEEEEEAPLPPPPVTSLPIGGPIEGVKSKRRAVLAVQLAAPGGHVADCKGTESTTAASSIPGLPATSAALLDEGGGLALGLGARASVRGLSREQAAAWCGALAPSAGEGEVATYRHTGLRTACVEGREAETFEASLREAAAEAPHLVCVRLGDLRRRRGGSCAALRGFKGALVVIEDDFASPCAVSSTSAAAAEESEEEEDTAVPPEEAAALLRTLGVTSRWRVVVPYTADASSVGRLEVDKLPAVQPTEVLGDLRPRDLETDPILAALVEDAQPLYDEHFHEDLLEDLKSKENARIAFLVRPGEFGHQFCGLIVYKLWGPPLRVMSILRVAVPQKFRRLGYGRQLMRCAMQKATQMPRTQCAKLTLCAMPEAIVFYERLGWTPIPEENLALQDGGEDCEGPRRLPGAIWMEYRCGRSVKPAGRR